MKPELKPCEDTLLLIHKSFCKQQQERIQNDLGHVYATAALECERAYEIGYEAGRKAAFAEIAAAKAIQFRKLTRTRHWICFRTSIQPTKTANG